MRLGYDHEVTHIMATFSAFCGPSRKTSTKGSATSANAANTVLGRRYGYLSCLSRRHASDESIVYITPWGQIACGYDTLARRFGSGNTDNVTRPYFFDSMPVHAIYGNWTGRGMSKTHTSVPPLRESKAPKLSRCPIGGYATTSVLLLAILHLHLQLTGTGPVDISISTFQIFHAPRRSEGGISLVLPKYLLRQARGRLPLTRKLMVAKRSRIFSTSAGTPEWAEWGETGGGGMLVKDCEMAKYFKFPTSFDGGVRLVA